MPEEKEMLRVFVLGLRLHSSVPVEFSSALLYVSYLLGLDAHIVIKLAIRSLLQLN